MLCAPVTADFKTVLQTCARVFWCDFPGVPLFRAQSPMCNGGLNSSSEFDVLISALITC